MSTGNPHCYVKDLHVPTPYKPNNMLMLCTPQAKGDLICLWVRADVLWSRRRPPRKQPLRQSFGHELLRALVVTQKPIFLWIQVITKIVASQFC